MSELISAGNQAGSLRRALLVTASTFALTACLATANNARADSTDVSSPPTVWVELGGQAEQMNRLYEAFAPPFVANVPELNRGPLFEAQRPSPFVVGEQGKISFMPTDTRWVFSASFLYGKSDNARHDHHQTALPYVHAYLNVGYPKSQPLNAQFGDGQALFGESHTVLDFQAGKDVGLGLFGAGVKSTFSAGVRYAQFNSHSDIALKARPEYKIFAPVTGNLYGHTAYGKPRIIFHYRYYHYLNRSYGASLETRRNMHAIGPSLTWDASVPVAGSGSTIALAVDWSVKGALLFGRQRTQSRHQTTGRYSRHFHLPFSSASATGFASSYTHGPSSRDNTRTLTIPNLGGLAAVSLNFPNAKIGLGYRADFFFGAIDGGIDTAKKENVGFYGPFATVSIGLGG